VKRQLHILAILQHRSEESALRDKISA